MTNRQLPGWLPRRGRACGFLIVFSLLFSPALVFSKGKKPPEKEVKTYDFDKEFPRKPKPPEEKPYDPGLGALEDKAEAVPDQEAPMEPAPAAAVAEEIPVVIPEGDKIHTVWIWQESRDCLWRLAKDYYGDPWKWKKIYLANRNNILDPNVIFPKQQIVIPQNQ